MNESQGSVDKRYDQLFQMETTVSIIGVDCSIGSRIWKLLLSEKKKYRNMLHTRKMESIRQIVNSNNLPFSVVRIEGELFKINYQKSRK